MSRYEHTSAFAGDIEAFLEFKASVGISASERDWTLMAFDRWCAERGATEFDRATVEAFVLERSARTSPTSTGWMSHIRQLGKFMRAGGNPRAYVLSDDFGASRPHPIPYLLDSDEAGRFFEAAGALRIRSPWAWQATCFFGLMHSLGLRPGECRRLGRGDIDLAGGFVDVVESKGNRSRRLPVTDQVAAMIRACDLRSDRELGGTRRAFFCSSSGAPVTANAVCRVFRRIWKAAGLPPSKGGSRPTPYAFRHRFAYANIERWAAEGTNVEAMLPYLSRYMGHATFSSTYYYVHTSPDFMSGYADAASALDAVLPEVGFDA